MPISVPTFEEQYKVGDFLNEADHLLTLNQRYYLKIINARTEREIDSREVLLDLPEMEYWVGAYDVNKAAEPGINYHFWEGWESKWDTEKLSNFS